MLNKIFKSGLIGVFALVMIVAITSCQKEKETIGIIIVKDSNGVVVLGYKIVGRYASFTLMNNTTVYD